MAPTKAQKTAAGKRNYGKNYGRGVDAENKAARLLASEGWSVSRSPGSRGRDDLIAVRGGKTKRVQVKNISSRALMSEDVARRRVQGEPYMAGRRSANREIWVYDRDGRLYRL